MLIRERFELLLAMYYQTFTQQDARKIYGLCREIKWEFDEKDDSLCVFSRSQILPKPEFKYPNDYYICEMRYVADGKSMKVQHHYSNGGAPYEYEQLGDGQTVLKLVNKIADVIDVGVRGRKTYRLKPDVLEYLSYVYKGRIIEGKLVLSSHLKDQPERIQVAWDAMEDVSGPIT